MGNLFANIPADLSTSPEELFETHLESSGDVKIERIVSYGHSTPPGQWYDQSWDEWVLLVSGSATLVFEGDKPSVEMKPGDYLLLPAGLRHRVACTDPEIESIWLAVHIAQFE